MNDGMNENIKIYDRYIHANTHSVLEQITYFLLPHMKYQNYYSPEVVI